MHINLSTDIEDINKAVKDTNKTVVMWGAGSCAESFLCEFEYGERIDYFVDADSKKIGTMFLDKPVYGIDRILNETEGVIVIIATMHFKDIIEKLGINKRDVYEIYSAFHVWSKKKFLGTTGLEQHMSELKQILSDERSKEIVEVILDKRKKMDIDYSAIEEDNQYFVEGIMKREKDAVLIDGGAYDGKTIDEMIAFQHNEFKRIYSFEMDKFNFEKISGLKYDDRVRLLNYGLWSEETICSYDANTTSSSLGEGGDYTAQCVALDSVCKDEKVTFIKMDIEGAETNALIGAESIIKRDKPQLAICLYHNSDDIWEIPLMLNKWVPEYKMYIRHHSETFTETVLYAVL